MTFDRTVETHTTTLTNKGIPVARAEVKAESTVVGKMSAAGGGILILGALGLALAVVLAGGEFTVTVLIGVGIIGFLGFALFAVGMTLISREASPMIAGLGEFVVKLVRALRGKNGGS